jgi:glycosyltransferase involved in cell wall biosynthesis
MSNKGAVERYADFLQQQGHLITKVAHFLDYKAGKKTKIYENANLIKEIRRYPLHLFNLFYDWVYNFRYVYISSFDVVVGANNFDTFSALCVRFLTKKDFKIIYFASDYAEERFNMLLLDSIYIAIENVVIRFADITVSNTRRAEAKRFELGMPLDKSVVVPNGTFLRKDIFPKKKINKRKFVYQGSVTREHGLYELLKELASDIEYLALMGGGDDWERVISLCDSLGLKYEAFAEKDHEFVVNYLQEFDGVGLAPYNNKSKWTYYASPLKVVDYITAGIPVLMSDVPEIASEVKDEGLGVVFHALDSNNIFEDLDRLDLENYETKAQKFYKKYNSQNLLSKIKL